MTCIFSLRGVKQHQAACPSFTTPEQSEQTTEGVDPGINIFEPTNIDFLNW